MANKVKIEVYTADWCTPCKELEYILQEVLEEYRNKIDIIYIDVDVDANERKVSNNYITGIPTMFFFMENEEEYYLRLVGRRPKEEIISTIESLLEEEK